jgi:hypothetical protein
VVVWLSDRHRGIAWIRAFRTRRRLDHTVRVDSSGTAEYKGSESKNRVQGRRDQELPLRTTRGEA